MKDVGNDGSAGSATVRGGLGLMRGGDRAATRTNRVAQDSVRLRQEKRIFCQIATHTSASRGNIGESWYPS